MLKEADRDILLFRSRFLKQKDYWENKLSGHFQETDIMLDYETGAGPEGAAKPGNVIIPLSVPLGRRIIALSKGSDLSVYILLLTALKALIYRYSGNEDIIIFSPVNRLKISRETLNSTLLLRDTVEGALTFKELVLRVRQSVLEAHENQDYPFDKLVESMSLSLPHIRCTLGNLHRDMDIRQIKTRLSFDFIREEDADRLKGELRYDLAACRQGEAARLVNHLVGLLEKAIENVDIKISGLSFLTGEEKHRLLIEFNNNRADFSRQQTIYHFVEAHAEKNPGSTAVSFMGTEITYGQLNGQVNPLAAILRDSGVREDQTVGILLNRSPLMMAGILAVWKAGGAYIPLDTDYPVQRISSILADSGCRVLVTQSQYMTPSLEKSFAGRIIKPDEDIGAAPHGFANPGLEIDMNSLSYVIYTSGSTGKPKGAMVEHVGMMNHIGAKINDLRVTEKSIVAQNASHTFDISVWQFFTAVVPGGKTVIYPDETVFEPELFISRVRKDNITILEVVPSYLSVMLDFFAMAEPVPLSVDYLLVTGEVVKPHLLERWFRLYPHIKVVNAYGPTEASDDITHHVMDKAPGRTMVPIGKPLQNLNIYIVDPHMNLCPPGVKGEIWVSGVGVGRGYLGDESRTRDVFIEDPFVEEKGIRLYKTGDIGRWLSDGTIEFFGRKDYQVKIRGFRIELGEIESHLTSYPDINEAAVIVKETGGIGGSENEGSGSYLCAFLAAAEERQLEVAAIRDYLGERLPDYMIPEQLVKLERMPLTANGKIDRKALQAVDAGDRLMVVKEYVPPRNPLEHKLVELWSELLGMEKQRIGIDANFFEMGGQSLKATLLAARIHKEFNVKIPLVEIFRASTIKELAEYLAEAQREEFLTIEPGEKKEYYALSSAQKRLYIAQQMDLESSAYNLAEVIPLAEDADLEKFADTFNKLIERHESLRTSFHMLDYRPVQRVHEGAAHPAESAAHPAQKGIEFKIEHYELNQDNKAQETHINRAFVLSRAPLLRAAVVRTGQEGYFLVAVMHHIISDDISHTILIKDFTALYNGEELPALRLQYKDYSEWQASPGQIEIIKKQEEYWLREFREEIPVLNLPCDYERPAIQGQEGEMIRFAIDKEETSALRRMALEEGATLHMTLLALYNVLLSKLSRQEDIIIGTIAAGRRHTDLERIIGMFVNTIALRNYPIGDRTFIEFLREVKERALEAFENQDFQFDDFVEKVVRKRESNRNPVFDVMFVFQNQAERRASSPEAANSEAYKSDTVWDLFLMVEETGENLALSFDYRTDLFKTGTIKNFIMYFKEIVSTVIKHKEIKLKDIKISYEFEANIILSEREKEQLLVDFNDNTSAFPRDRSIHQFVEQYAEISPDRVAVTGPAGSLTYRELNRGANRLAWVLRYHGIGEDHPTAILLPRSPLVVECILAVWKAGGAYIPIDMDFPRQRILEILNDSNAAILLTESHYFETGEEEIYAGKIIPLDRPLDKADEIEKNTGNPDLQMNMSSLSYVIYTSGSTGKPKGVMVEHIGMMNHIQAKINDLQLTADSIVAQNSPLTFDISVWQLFAVLIVKGKAVIYPDELILEPGQFLLRLIKDRITILEVVPSYLGVLLDTPGAGEGSLPLDYLLVTGEEIKAVLVEKWFNRFPGIKMVNAYGPTEASDDITHCIMDKAPGRSQVPIGKPVQNFKIYIVDDHMRLCPVGVKGEIWVSGVGVGRGYLNDVEKTIKAFREDPFREEKVERLYKTGDLGCWLPDGAIDFFGRKDYQVKIRGYRIELGEIEAQLLKFNGVKEAVVIDRKNESGEKYLCAYIVLRKPVNGSGLRKYLVQKLPDYMIPSHFVTLEQLPLTPNGKIDRKALPEPVIGSKTVIYLSAEKLNKSNVSFTKREKEVDEFFQAANEGDLLSDRERERMLFTFNDTASEFPADKMIHQLFEDQVEKTPNNTALAFAGRELTYHLLNRRVNQLARVLRVRSTGEFFIAGIRVDRSLEMMIGILAIFKAGGAFMPIDPEAPEERQRFVVDDAGVELLLTNTNAGAAVYVYKTIDLEDENNYKGDSGNPPVLNSPTDLSHILYTSGTTGIPKGVLLENRSVVNLMTAVADLVEFREDDNVASVTPITFDVFSAETILPLTKGSKVVIAPQEALLDYRIAAAFIEKENITMYQSTPSILQRFISDPAAAKRIRNLRHLLIAGEALFDTLVKQLKHHTGSRIYNLYGPAETTLYSTAVDLTAENTVSIGKPLFNTRISIVDRKGNLVPIGVPGELCISGSGVARGYLNRPELTAEKFSNYRSYRTNRTYSLYFSKKLYRTGDLARWLPDGNIEFIGRIDHQVKIAGIRIEPGEIENCLLKFRGIREAAVVVRQKEDNENYLCAFLVADHLLEESEVRIWISRKLPNYMLPSLIVQLEIMPVTPNRKIDRKLLAAVKIETDAGKYHIAPRNEMEEKLVDIWGQTLGISRETISIDANFFELGGHSLNAMMMAGKINDAFAVRIPLVGIFITPTVRELAQYIEREEKKFITVTAVDERLVLLRDAGRKSTANLFFIHEITGQTEAYIELSKHLPIPFNCYGIRVDSSGWSDYVPGKTTVGDFAGQYIEVIRKIQAEGPYYIAGYSIGGTIAFEMARQLERQNQDVKFLGLIDAPGPLKELREKEHQYTLEDDLQGIDQWLSNLKIKENLAAPLKEKLSRLSDLSQVWPLVSDYFAENNIPTDTIKKTIPAYVARLIPNFDQMGIRELIGYQTVIRSVSMAVSLYIPAGKVNTRVHFFIPAERENHEEIQNWTDFCSIPILSHEVAGNHISMMHTPNVRQFAGMLKHILDSI